MQPIRRKLLICPLSLPHLKGDRKGLWAVTIGANWRIIFRFEDGQASMSNGSITTERRTAVPLKNPIHPGRIVKQDCLEPLGLSVTKAAEVLCVSRQAVNNLVHAKAGISPEMAIRLSKAFGSTAETWLQMQMHFDLAQARKNESKIKVERFQPKEARP